MNTGKTKILTFKEAVLKAMAYCSYQERSQQEVRDKLYSWGLKSVEVEQGISQLITENFLNEERFAKIYAGGKFRIKKWGRLKIKNELRKKQVSEYCIKTGLSEINEADYLQTIKKLIGEKEQTVTAKNSFAKKQKIAQYIIFKGYESDIVWAVINEEIK